MLFRSIARDPQYLARQMIQKITLPDGTPLTVPGIVPKLTQTPGDANGRGPELGEHTDAVLSQHGYSQQEIAALRERQAI